MTVSNTQWVLTSGAVAAAGTLGVGFALLGHADSSFGVISAITLLLGIAMLVNQPLVAIVCVIPGMIITLLLMIQSYLSGNVARAVLLTLFATGLLCLSLLVASVIYQDSRQIF